MKLAPLNVQELFERLRVQELFERLAKIEKRLHSIEKKLDELLECDSECCK